MTKGVIRNVSLSALLAAAVVGSMWGCGRYRSYEALEKSQQNQEKEWLIARVQASRFGSMEWRDQIASDFLDEKTTTDSCEWLLVQTWHGSTKNPNWVSLRKGSDGANLICETYAHDQYNSAIWFEYDFQDGRGIMGLKWGYE